METKYRIFFFFLNHRSGLVIAGFGDSLCYAQVYFYYVDTTVDYRLRKHITIRTCNNIIIREISLELESIYSFI